jgi:hypothetical protein
VNFERRAGEIDGSGRIVQHSIVMKSTNDKSGRRGRFCSWEQPALTAGAGHRELPVAKELQAIAPSARGVPVLAAALVGIAAGC